MPVARAPTEAPAYARFLFIGDRLWLDFVNTAGGSRDAAERDSLSDFDTYVEWLEQAAVLDTERAGGLRRRALQQPAGASAALLEAYRVRLALRALAERGAGSTQTRRDALAEVNRILGRSTGTRRVDLRDDGAFVRTFVPVGDAFAGLLMPVVESAADALVLGELPRVRRCAAARCTHVFYDATRNGSRRWCQMETCGNRAKAARHRRKRALRN